MRKAPKFLLLAALGFLCGLLVVACDDVVEDATFRMWCGDKLCAWNLEAGHIRQAPTWHKDDHGVEFIDTPTVISQAVMKSPACLTFTTIANVDPSAQVTIGLDFNRDGTIDYEQPIAATDFQETKTQVTAPPVYDGIRFVISKRGVGRAVLAQMRVQSGEKCSAPPAPLRDLALGTPCANDNECRSGICCQASCGDCCVLDEVVPDGGASFVPRTCSNGGTCERRAKRIDFAVNAEPRIGWRPPPMQCDPGTGEHHPGAECLADDDCASGVCEDKVIQTMPLPTGTADACAPAFPDAGASCEYSVLRGGRCR